MVSKIASTTFQSICLVAAASLMTPGCGDSGGGSDKKPIINTARTKEVPIDFNLTDDDCQESGDNVDLTKTSIYAWVGESTTLKEINLQGIHSANSLQSDLVKETIYGEKYSRLCDYARGMDLACLDSDLRSIPWTIDAAAKPLRICKSKTFKRDTFEATALTSIYYLNESFKRYNEIDRGQKPLDRISLSILPRFSESYDNVPLDDGKIYRVETFYTHNLAYQPDSQNPSVIVFPEDKINLEAANGSYLWESHFVLAHEFGHHIDLDRNGAFLKDMGLSWNPLSHRFDDLLAESKGITAGTGRSTLSGAVAEGTADLLAFYALGGNAESLVGLPCFGKSRDIGRPTFANGDSKVLTEDRLALLFGRLEETGGRECNDVAYSDIHIGGAIIAHALNLAFAQLAQSSVAIEAGKKNDFDARYKMTLAWLDDFRARVKGLSLNATDDDVLRPLADSLETVTNSWLAGANLRDSEATAAIRTSICKIMETQIPVLPRSPFALTSGSCG